MMSGMIDNFYTKMRDEHHLAPSNDTTIDSENDKALHILRPGTALKFNDWVLKHPEDSADPKKRRANKRLKSASKSKIVLLK